MAPANILAGLPLPGGDEQFLDIARWPGCRIERIVSHGHTTPADQPYRQSHDEWVLLLAGHAVVNVEGVETELCAGDHLRVPAGARHRVIHTDHDGATIWLAIHVGEQTATENTPPPGQLSNSFLTGGILSRFTDWLQRSRINHQRR